MSNKINNCRIIINELLVEKKLKEAEITKWQERAFELGKNIDELRVMQEVLQTASKLMYSNLSIKLGAIITEGLTLVFPDDNLQFCIDFVERRNQIEADLYLMDADGNQYDPMTEVGGGITDFISLLLRITYVKLSTNKDFIFCDEPSKFISRDKIVEATEFLAKICKDLNFELLCITHIPEMVDVASRAYLITSNGKDSKVRITKKLKVENTNAE